MAWKSTCPASRISNREGSLAAQHGAGERFANDYRPAVLDHLGRSSPVRELTSADTAKLEIGAAFGRNWLSAGSEGWLPGFGTWPAHLQISNWVAAGGPSVITDK